MRIALLSLWVCFTLQADVKSTTGQINFELGNEPNPTMILNSVGLGIGVSPMSNLHVAGNAIFSGNLFIGSMSGHSTLTINGTVGWGFDTLSSNMTLSSQTMVFANSLSDNITLTLPYAGNVSGRVYRIKKTTRENYVSIVAQGANDFKEHIFESSQSSGALPSAEFISSANTWHLLSRIGVSERWDPTATSNIALWFDASDASTITASSGNVSQWRDKSGNDYHVAQSTANKHPKTNTRTINGLNVLDFNGTSQLLTSVQDVFTSNQNYTKVVVYFTDNLGALNNLITIGNSAFYQELSMWHNGNQFGSSSYPGVGVPMVAIGRYEAGVQSDIFINGSNVGTNGAHGVWANDGNHLLIASHGGSSYLDGVIAEIVVFDYAASTDLREKVEGYLAWKWGLRGYLPTSHPYKNSPPS